MRIVSVAVMYIAASAFGLGASSAVAAPVAEPAKNLIVNPSFEEAAANSAVPAGWSGNPQVYSLDSTVAKTGKASLKYVNDDPKRYALCYQAKVPVRPGWKCRFSVWVKTQNIAGNETGATICMEWQGKDGKWLGGAYPDGIRGTHDWTLIEHVTRLPENAVTCNLSCYVRKGMTGTAWFDDVTVRPYRAPLITGLTAGRYRGTYDGGEAEILVGLEVPQEGGRAVDIALTATLVDAAGTAHGQPRLLRPEPGLAVVRLDTTPLPAGAYTLRVAATGGDGRYSGQGQARLRRVEGPVARRVSIDEFGRVIADGRPFFPLGTYWSGVSDEHLALYAASPFNCLMPYGAANPAQMDAIHRHGLKIIYSIKDYYAGTRWAPKAIQTVADERPAVEKTVLAHRDHPALLAWYLNDELPADMIDRLAAHQEWLEELDPDHPTWVVLYQVDEVRHYLSSFDVIGTDPYPIPSRPAAMALDWTRRTHQAGFGRRAVWQVPQIFNWGAYRKGAEREASRAPTALEMRSMAWQCIAGGANGLIFYSWFDLWKMNDVEPFEQRWAEVTAMAADIRRMIPVLLSVEPVPAVVVTGPAAVASRQWSLDGALYVLVVNSGTDEAAAQVALPGGLASVTAEVGTATLAPAEKAVGVTLGALEPCVLRITLKP